MYLYLVDVRHVRVVPIPVAFQVEPVLSFVVRVGSLLKPPAAKKKEDLFNMNLEVGNKETKGPHDKSNRTQKASHSWCQHNGKQLLAFKLNVHNQAPVSSGVPAS